MFEKLTNTYLYGKSGKGDYDAADMPANRRQLFLSALRLHWSGLVGLNLLYLICWIPTIIWSISYLSLMLTAENTTSAAEYANMLISYFLVLAPCIAITGSFTAGISLVMRNWARDEHSFALSDFWDAIKENWRQALVISSISGLMPFIACVACTFYGQMAQSSPIFIVPCALILVVFVLWKLCEMVIYMLMTTYRYSLKHLLQNALVLTLANLPLAIGIKLLTLLAPILTIAILLILPESQNTVLMIFCIFYFLFLPALNRLLIAAYANAVCEKYLNPRIEGADTRIGLRPEDSSQ